MVSKLQFHLSLPNLTVENASWFESICYSKCDSVSKVVLHPFSKQKQKLQNSRAFLFFELLTGTFLFIEFVALNGVTNFKIFLNFALLQFIVTPWSMWKYLHMTIFERSGTGLLVEFFFSLIYFFLLLVQSLLLNFSYHFHGIGYYKYF